MKMFKTFLTTVLFITLALPCTASALTLPGPEGYYDGIPVALQYDDFYSYNIHLLDALEQEGYLPLPEGEDSYLYKAGVGNQDIVLYTQAKGISNQNIGPEKNLDFEDPTINPAGNQSDSFSGWWGQNDQDNDGTADAVNGPVTVGQILEYLQAFNPDNNTPVFTFDLNQQGDTPGLFSWGQVTLLDPATRDIVEYWAFDNTTNGMFDEDPVWTPGELNLTGESGTEYDLSFNTGSGSADYFLYSPWMNLSLFESDLLFVTEFHFDGLNDGAEELFLSGAVAPSGNVIPEPSTIILLGFGVLGIIGLRFKRKH